MNDASYRSAAENPWTSSASAMRQLAETIVREGEVPLMEPLDSLSIEAIRQTIHELRVHQIELEMQNDELRRAQVRLTAANKRYFDHYDLAPMGYCTINAAGLIVNANLTAATLLGATRSKLVKRSFFQLLLRADQDNFYLMRQRLIETGETQTEDFRMGRDDGSHFWAQLVASATQGEDDAPALHIAFSNISGRRQTERELHLSEAKIRSTLDAIPDLMFEVDLDGRYHDLHSPHTESLIAPIQEQLGKLVSEVLPADAAKVVMAALQEANELGYSRGKQYSLVLKHGKMWFELSISRKAILPGQSQRFVGLSRNITERIESEEKLQASEVRYHSVVSVLSEAVLIHTRDGSIASWNAAAEHILGLSSEEMRGRKSLDPRWQTIHEDGSAFPRETHPSRVVLRTGTPQLNVVMGICKRDDSLTWVSINAVPIFDHGDLSPSSAVVSFSDITSRRAAEAELEQYRQHLEELVTQRTQEIETLNAELTAKARDAEAANIAKGAFLATMSHELRTPLNAVVGLAGLLVSAPLSRRQHDYAEKIKLSAQALRLLIDDILDYSKIEAGELRLEHAPFSLDALLRTTAAVMGVSLGHKPIETFFDVGPDIPDALIGDALRLQQILLNLTSNAVKFTSTGMIVVSVRRLPQADAQQGCLMTLRVCVRDTGIGIGPEHLGSIFGAFAQANASTSRKYGGTGLGLSISERLAALMGGQIGVQSTLGQGSEFCLEVPLTVGRRTPRAVREGIPSTLSILIVDDNPLACDLLTRTCKAFGWHASAVNSGAAGLQELYRSAAAGHDYDLLLLDWHMPGMNGLEMLRQASTTAGIGLPLVVLMAPLFELELAVAASEDIELDAIATKPMLPSSLLEAVTRAYAGDYTASLPLAAVSDQRLAGLRLLVAEDNPLNQEVIVQILTRAGATVILVGDGVAAVAALRLGSEHFDAVLMDVQMPLMDGYTATRIIREELGLVDLPIIAVTAIAQPQDLEKSRLVGMVGHVVKPLNVEDLLDLLMEKRRFVVMPPNAGKDLAAQNMMAANKPDGLNISAGLKLFGGDAIKYGGILRKFVLQHGGDVDVARHLVSVHDHEAAIHLLHGLIGVASLLQAHGLAQLSRAAEEALRSSNAEAILVLFDKLQVAMDSVKACFLQFETIYAGN